MLLLYLLGILFLVLLAAVFFGRVFAWLLEIIAQRVLHLDLKVETLGLFAANGVRIKTSNGVRIGMEKICLHCKWTMNDSKRLFTLLFKSVVIEVEREKHQTKLKKPDEPQGRPNSSSSNFVAKHKQILSRVLRKCCQYLGIQVSSVELQLRSKDVWLTQCILPDGLHVSARPDNTNCLLCTLEISKMATKFFSGTESEVVAISDPFAQLSCSFLMEISLVPFERSKFLKAAVNMKNLDIWLSEGLAGKTPEQAVNIQTESKESSSTVVTPMTFDEIQDSISGFPESAELAVDAAKVTFLNKDKRELVFEVNQAMSSLHCKKNLQNGLTQDPTHCDLSIQMSGISLKSTNCCKLCKLNRLRFTSKLSGHNASMVLASKLYIESVRYSHVQEEFIYWLEYLKSRRKFIEVNNTKEDVHIAQVPKPGILSRLPDKLEIIASMEVTDCFSSVFVSSPLPIEEHQCYVVLAFLAVNVKMSSQDMQQGILGKKLSCSFQVENVYLCMDTSQSLKASGFTTNSMSSSSKDYLSIPPSSTRHVWGRVLALGSCSVKCETDLRGSTEKCALQVHGEACSLVVEWSHDVFSFLLKWLSGLKASQASTVSERSYIGNFALDVDFRLSGVNMFYIGRLEGGADSFMARIDFMIVTITSIADWSVNNKIGGIKLHRSLKLERVPYPCVASTELENGLINIPLLSVSHSDLKPYAISVEEIIVNWDPTLHMAIHDRLQEATQDITELKATMRIDARSGDNHLLSEKESKPITLSCDISWLKLRMQTSPKTSFGVESRRLSVSLQGSCFEVDADYTALLFDEVSVVKFQGGLVKRLPHVDEIQKVRSEFKQLETKGNTAWIIKVEKTEILFPFMFNYAASRDELANVTRMLKQLHKNPKDDSYQEPLPPDLWLLFEDISFVLEDDPFEVKLRDNYALLLDEMEQWNERKQLLEAKLDEIRKKPGNSLTVKKEEALKRSLEEKNSQIYIQRSQTLYEQTPKRTTLLTWEFHRLDLIVLSDKSHHGKRAIDVMKELDRDSPYPTSGLKFTTLWCRTIHGKLQSHECRLRDFPQAIFTSKCVEVKGTLLGAEQHPANRAKREAVVAVGKPWSNVTVSRSLTALKFFYDLKFDMDVMELAWGVDIDAAVAMVSIAFENLTSPKRDPSKNLPFFDKIRLLYHGRLQMAIKEWNWYLSASRNPYDTRERMQWEWRQANFDWTNGRVVVEGDFDLHIRAASKYDDRRVLHLPSLKLCANIKWICQGDPNDHHSVIQCAPDKIPELAPNQVHDSYAAFRSQNLILDLSLDIGMSKRKDHSISDPPTVFMYASTFRWLQKYQAVVFSNVSRPIRRGTYFDRERLKKRSLGRHYREVSLSFQFPELSVWYWGSFTQQRGFEMSLGSGYLETTYRLALREYKDGLIRRPAADWSATKLCSELSNVTCHLYGLEEVDGKENSDECAEVSSIDLEPTKYYLLAAQRLEYTRQDNPRRKDSCVDGPSQEFKSYSHRLVCHDLKGAWTLTNRRIAFGLFEAYTNAQVLKKNLSADALKFIIVEKKDEDKQDNVKSGATLDSSGETHSVSYSNMLEKLVMEKDMKFVAFAEEGTGEHEHVTETHLHGVAMCTANDVIEDKWHIALVNSQIVLKGIESEGCVLVAAGNARILKRLHMPVWSNGEIFNKGTWVGKVENLQYFATVGSEDNIGLDSTPWLSTSVITGRLDKNSFDIADLANIVGSGEAVGGMVNAYVGRLTGQEPTQLQRIVARCSCEFYFVSFSPDLDPIAEEYAANIAPPQPSSSHLREDSAAVNTFTIGHKLLEISTNSAQYTMLIDIAHNVVLYTEPKKKEAFDRLQRMRFHLHLSTSEDQRAQILRLQNTVRSNHVEMRRLERELYEVNLVRKQAIDDQELTEAVIQLEREVIKQKELLNSSSTELRIMISAYKDFLMNFNTPTPERAPTTEVIKLAEVYFNHASWQLNQEDGQLAIADVTFTDFSYRKTTLSGATMEHRLELGKFHVRNLLPNSIYKDALSPLDVSGKGHVDRAIAVRLFSRVRPPVGGIGVKEHFELNVCPLAVRLTHRLFKKVMVFFFPQREHEYEGEGGQVELGFRGMEVEDKDLFIFEDEDISAPPPVKSTSLKRTPSSVSTASSRSSISVSDSPPMSPAVKDKGGKKKSTFYKRISDYDDLEKMKERASKNNTFIYVKIPEVALLVSYKGEKDRNITDVRNFSLVIPTLEYHNRTWTWHDLLMAMKKDCVNVLVSQAIKEKLHLVGGHGAETKESKSQAKEEDKARMLLGGFPKDQQKNTKKKLLSKLAKVTRGSKRRGLLQPDGAGPEPVDLEEEEDFDEFGGNAENEDLSGDYD
ncbi:bridge-like lipid transfer protein family member 2 isoform X2 [Montipora foliosa]|uniref:bridge-like lipid transfer protein family member 2 isoform X2 n=1 Tax=Montipora foliosa TaxID=591990 RepID=UPI0035F1530B